MLVICSLLTTPAISQEESEFNRGDKFELLLGSSLGFKEGLDWGVDFGIGYQINSSWDVELRFNRPGDGTYDYRLLLDLDEPIPGIDTNVFSIGANLIHNFDVDKKFSRYALVGIRSINYSFKQIDPDIDNSSTFQTSSLQDMYASVGLGFRYAINSNFSLRIEAEAIYSWDTNVVDPQAHILLTYSFNPNKFFNASYSDVDGDRIRDSRDSCPDTPNGVKVNSLGCPVDDDLDGIANYLDQCPESAKGSSVNSKGCPADKDNDGVADDSDRCMSTPRNKKVDVYGCSLTPLKPVILKVLFDFDYAVIDEEDRIENLPSFLAMMSKYSDIKVLLQGYSDRVGPNSYNSVLSKLRAERVKEYLVRNHGLDSDRILTKGCGSSKSRGRTPASRAQDRRVQSSKKTWLEARVVERGCDSIPRN